MPHAMFQPTSSYFNPRSLTGATQGLCDTACRKLISIHAPLRERPKHRFNCLDRWQHFNPRSLTGATVTSMLHTRTIEHFNPRSLTGATQVRSSSAPAPKAFQSTLPYGSDPNVNTRPSARSGISIHAPLRERPHLK